MLKDQEGRGRLCSVYLAVGLYVLNLPSGYTSPFGLSTVERLASPLERLPVSAFLRRCTCRQVLNREKKRRTAHPRGHSIMTSLVASSQV
jgi:hypothetical protein